MGAFFIMYPLFKLFITNSEAKTHLAYSSHGI
jgi:hypothetical protein